jgi:uncharacterized membrane protein (UPF0182 family)
VSSLIEQDPAISYQFGLWNRAGSRLIHGNLLVLPVGRGLLYVEPIYLQSRNNDLPTLVRVVVTDGRTIVMERNLQQALNELVSRKARATSTAPMTKVSAAKGAASPLVPPKPNSPPQP